MLSASVSFVGSYVPCLVVSEGFVLLVFFIPSGSCSLSVFSSVGCPELIGKGFSEDTPSRAMHPKDSPTNVWLRVSASVPVCGRRKLL